MGAFDDIKTFGVGTLKGVARGGTKGLLASLALGGVAATLAGGLAFWALLSVSMPLAIGAGVVAAALAGMAAVGNSAVALAGFGAGVGGLFGGAKEFSEEKQRIQDKTQMVEQKFGRIAATLDGTRQQLGELHEHARGYGNLTFDDLAQENALLRQALVERGQQMGNYGPNNDRQREQGQRGRQGPSPLDPSYYEQGGFPRGAQPQAGR